MSVQSAAAAICGAAFASTASANLTPFIELVDPSDGISLLPPDVIAVDILVKVPGATFRRATPDDPAGPIIFLSDASAFDEPGTFCSSFNANTPVGFDWSVWYVPEPSLSVLFAAACASVGGRGGNR